MGSHPLNLFLRFILEITALFAVGYWGWSQHPDWLKFSLTIGSPIMLALIWGIFAVPNDPSRSGKTVIVTPGWIRLVIEISIFGLATLAFFDVGNQYIALIYLLIVILHYGFSIDRIKWLFKQ